MSLAITVVTPYFDPKGKDFWMLKELVASVEKQSIPPVEVLISSVHVVPKVHELIALAKGKFPIRVVKSFARNAPENINFAVSEAYGTFVKLLFHDDVLANADSLERTSKALMSSPSYWLVAATKNFSADRTRNFNLNQPRFSRWMALGANTLGAPSAVMFEKAKYVSMDSQLAFLYDCDWYLAMRDANGDPTLMPSLEVLVRIHEGQATNTVKNLRWTEARAVLRKYPKSILRRTQT